MRRLKLSLAGGILFPFLYLVLLSILFNLGERNSDYYFWVESVRPFLVFLISWASYIYFYFFPPDPDFLMFAEFAFGNILSLIVGNFFLYSMLSSRAEIGYTISHNG